VKNNNDGKKTEIMKKNKRG